MAITFEELKNNTFGMRGSFTNHEVEGLISFLDHMKGLGHNYSLHPIVASELHLYSKEGFLAVHTEPPELGIVFAKVESGRGLFRKKYSYHMYVAKLSDMNNLKKHFEYPKFFESFKNIALLREGMKI